MQSTNQMLHDSARLSNSLHLLLTSLAVVILAFTFMDFFRRFVGESKWLLVTLDIVVLSTYLIYFAWVRHGRIGLRMNRDMAPLILVLALLFVWTVAELALSVNQSLTISIAGFRSYWLAVPMLAIGYHLAQRLHDKDYDKIYRFFLTLSIIVIAFSLIQLATDRSSYSGFLAKILSPMGHGVHSYGDSLHELSSSFFASSKRYGKYLVFCYLVLWAINRARNRSNWMLFGIFTVGFYSAGSREALWIFLLFHIMYIFTVSSKRGRNVMVVAALAMAVAIGIIATPSDRGKVANDSQRLTFLFAYGESLAERIKIMFPVTNIRTDNADFLFGMGLGRYGSEALLDPTVAEKVDGLEEKFFYPHDFFRSAMSFADAGLSKIVIELGVGGMALYMAFLAALLFIALKAVLIDRRNSLSVAGGFWILAWIFFFLKAHVTISDLMLSVFLFCVAGFLVGGAGGHQRRYKCMETASKDFV